MTFLSLYVYKHTHTESRKEGTLLYLDKNLKYKLREHRQKTFVPVNWRILAVALRGWGELSESVKKEKLVTKIFFQIVLNEGLKMCDIC